MERDLERGGDVGVTAAGPGGPPAVTLPKGGGAVRGIGEKFSSNLVTGTGSLSIPIFTSPSRSQFQPALSLSYDSGSGNGPFGLGWSLSTPAITRRTDKGLPRYRDTDESDVYLLSGAEDLVPVLRPDGSRFEDDAASPGYRIHRYRPRVEGSFARIERWTDRATGEIHWRSITRDNVTTVYGRTGASRVADPDNSARVFTWLICESHDDRGNAIVYEYAAENDDSVDRTQPSERNRARGAGRYLKRVKYGNRVSRLLEPDLTAASWLFELVFDYDEGHYETLAPDPSRPAAEQHELVRASVVAGRAWAARPDPFSSCRAGFEVRTHRRCRRVLMFHHFDELGGEPCLVRSTELDYADLDYADLDDARPVTPAEEAAHQGSTRFASFIQSVTQSGFVRDDTVPVLRRGGADYVTYRKKSLPPLELEYSKAVFHEELRELDAGSLDNLPSGLAGASTRWVDLNGEGVSGVLTEQADAWFYKRNLGGGRLGPQEEVTPLPSLAALGSDRQELLDLSGDGQLDLVAFGRPAPGFYERTDEEGWERFKPFAALPNVSWSDPNLRFIDLTGDGHADILISEDHVFTWFASLAEAGFDAPSSVPRAFDEEKGPALVFSDATQSVYLSDMSGDGLTDIVRIRNGEICYWPNLGYGRFGAKVTMANAPRFDAPERFDLRRVLLADIDGSGVTDILYVGRDGVSIYLNQSGNRWSDAHRLKSFPRADGLSSVTAVDLLGNGTACLVWSSPLPGDTRRPLRYVDLLGGRKPHLLVRNWNNLGAETRSSYAPSTRFYLADRQAGRPWITRLPFPVHVVERVETYDHISRNRFVTRYAYHHGYFDGAEREFRGFGMVEQWDTEELAALNAGGDLPPGDNFDAASHVPPVYTKTWFHTGVYLGRERVSNFFAGLLDARDPGEYYREPAWSADDAEARARLLEDTVLPDGLTLDEEREACRALKGSMLRQEVYALDGSDKEADPYAVTEQSFAVAALQRRGPNRHAVFFTHIRETLSYQYERRPADPRLAHTLALEVDELGNVLKSASVAYGRRRPDEGLPADDRATQAQTRVTYTETRVTNAVEGAFDYRAPLPCETRTYELTGYAPTNATGRFSAADFVRPDPDDPRRLTHIFDGEARYEETPGGGGRQRRLIEHTRILFRRDDLTGLLPLGALESLALPGESYKLAFTPGLLTRAYGGRVTDEMLEAEGRYVRLEGDDGWWAPWGRTFYAPADADAARELEEARRHFFVPRRFRDPFHTEAVSTETNVSYDAYDLLLKETLDAVGNVVTTLTADDGGRTATRLDYRVLQPYWLTDPNGNRTAVAFDALCMVVGVALMGKAPPAPAEGDSLAGFEADLTESAALAYLRDPLADPRAVLGRATTRFVYDLFAYQRTKDEPVPQPSVLYTLARETHDSEPEPEGGLRFRHAFAYFDGFGRTIQQKLQAEPGPLPLRDPVGKIVLADGGRPEMLPAAGPRWVAGGWTVFNNKGKPVRSYEPFFTDDHRFEPDLRVGVSPVIFYDPVGRVAATLSPDHTWNKAVFDPWRQEMWDASDTALAEDPRTDPDVGDFFRRLPEADFLPTWHARRVGGALGPQEQDAALKAAVHAGTPSVAHADALGRVFLTVTHNRFRPAGTSAADPPAEELLFTRAVFDVEGNQREIVDALGRVVVRYEYDMLGSRVRQASMEAGERWTLNDVSGKPLYAWDGRGHRFRAAYDPLRRQTDSFLREGAGAEALIARTIYGEDRSAPEGGNLRGRIFRLFDQAGAATNEAFDFKGNLLRGRRDLARAYDATLDWSADVELESPPYVTRNSFDALNRTTEMIAPDDSRVRPGYNEAHLLERLEVNLRGEECDGRPVWTPFVTNIDYDAKGQRTLIEYGNGAATSCTYDPVTFRLSHLQTWRDAAAFPGDCPQPTPDGWPGCQVQNLHYTYDPVGNLTHVRDDAQQAVYFRNKRVEPSADYTYDALYRLIEAAGREHLGQVGGAPAPTSYNDRPRVGIPLASSDGNAVGRYLERYVYDAVGNLERVIHRGSDPAHPGWTRAYAYDEPSLLEPDRRSNRLSATAVGSTTETYSARGDGYDAHGNMLCMPQLQAMQWDFKDQLRMTRRQAVNDDDGDGRQHQGERTWYAYDGAGRRVRKVTETAAGQVREERVYLGGFEVYRRHGVDPLVRETLAVADGERTVALVETRTQGLEGDTPARLVRYQLGNHLGSASLELDDRAQIISYEEYYPFGGTSFQAVRSQTETPKRYRYTGRERDEESGLYHNAARYYAPWLGRWTSCDPTGVADGLNLYAYVSNNPVRLVDPRGTNGDETRIVNPGMTAVQPKGTVSNFAVTFPDPVTGEPVLQLIDKAIPAQNQFMSFPAFLEEKGTPLASGAPSTQTTGQKTFHRLLREGGVEVTIVSKHAKAFGYKYGQKVFMKEGHNFAFVDMKNLADFEAGTATVYGTRQLGTPPHVRRGGVDLGPVRSGRGPTILRMLGVAGTAAGFASELYAPVAGAQQFDAASAQLGETAGVAQGKLKVKIEHEELVSIGNRINGQAFLFDPQKSGPASLYRIVGDLQEAAELGVEVGSRVKVDELYWNPKTERYEHTQQEEERWYHLFVPRSGTYTWISEYPDKKYYLNRKPY